MRTLISATLFIALAATPLLACDAPHGSSGSKSSDQGGKGGSADAQQKAGQTRGSVAEG